jgi:RND family efflux transporter MFP subunit
MMKKKTLAILVGVAAVVGAGTWYSMKAPAEGGGAPAGGGKGKGGEMGPTTVNVIAPARQDVPVTLSANGTVSPISTVDLHPQTTSTIVKVHVKEGQFVKQGELMFTLDSRSATANVEKADAQVQKDRATLADLDRQYKRAQELVAQKFMAQSSVDTLKAQVDSQRAVLESNVAAARAMRVDQSYNTIRAPQSGRVGAINVYPGSLVQLATSLTTITQLDPINVAFNVPEANLAALLDAQRAGRVQVQAFQNNSDKPVNGELSFVDNTVDPVAGVIRVKGRFDNKDTRLWPGQYVTTRLTVATLKGALVVPQNAIITNTRGTFVYTVAPDQTAKVTNIKRLYAFGANAAVEGLQGDEKVIVEGKQNLRPGGKVRIADAKLAQQDGAGEGQGNKKGKAE